MKKTSTPFESESAVSITNGAERGKNKLPVTSNTAVDRTPGKSYRSRYILFYKSYFLST